MPPPAAAAAAAGSTWGRVCEIDLLCSAHHVRISCIDEQPCGFAVLFRDLMWLIFDIDFDSIFGAAD